MAGEQSASRYVRVLHASLSHPKFVGDSGQRPLTAAERGTWVVALVLADIAHPEPIHESAVRLHCQDADFEELYERQLLERNGGPGWFRVHDLKQFHVAPSSTPEAVRDRVARHREKKRLQRIVTPETDVTDVTTDETIRNERDESFSRDVERIPGARAGRPKVRGFSSPGEEQTA